ncbi:DUF1361 domain-containing protein [Streptococcus entericus]|uniref:DUF1361 domain-containing protein n=1 Tax=Streptococcus entericus TaxID=155680 RepID=UPI000376C0F3|nr:DUF1361 domain-containing protein [Streptococcus entericus]
MLRKLVVIHLCFLALAASMLYINFTGPNLTWNMGLSLIALNCSAVAASTTKWYIRLPFLLAWFFFFPNTFYMLTDIVHMHFTSTVLWERSSMILFMLYVPSILLGVFSGVLSVRYAFESLKIRQPYLRWVLIVILSSVSSFAIHIGRYARLNSWDILTRPKLVIDEMLAVVSREALPFIIGFTFIQIMVLIFMEDDR